MLSQYTVVSSRREVIDLSQSAWQSECGTYLQAWDHGEDVLRLVLSSLLQWVSLQVEILQLGHARL
jgi:hypothetical protein